MADVIYWNAETLATYANDTKDVKIGDWYFKIVKLKASIIDNLDKLKTFDLIEQGLIEPSLKKDQIRSMPIDMAKDLATEILKFSGMDLEQAEKN